ncbi:MAG: hypothetical protein NZ455_16835, partial [Bacteroidia bacterium]|nr:hypothetical protein [Bacteroidia bacterium]
ALFKKELFKKQHSPPGDGTVINILAFVLAVLSIPLCWIPVLGLLLSVAALVLGIIGAGRTLKGLGIAAIVIGAITLIISLIITLIFI